MLKNAVFKYFIKYHKRKRVRKLELITL